jgi:hypothetical protein
MMRDGVILEDHAVSKRTNAAAQLQKPELARPGEGAPGPI